MNNTDNKDDKNYYTPLKDMLKLEDTNDPSRKIKMEDILKNLNSYSSRFQIKTVVIITLVFSVVGMHVFTFVYMFLSPDFFSLEQNPQSKIYIKTNYSELSEEEACTQGFRASTNFETITSEYKLYCEKRYMKELGEFLMMVAASVMTIFLSMIQDMLGRKKMVLVCFVLPVVGFGCIYFGNSLFIKLVGVMFFWSYMEVLSIALIVLMNELLVNPLRKYSVNMAGISICLMGLLGNFITNYCSSYVTIVLIIFLYYLVGFLFILVLIPESPSYLLKQNKIRELRKVIRKIAQTNGLSGDQTNTVLADLDHVIECKSLSVYNYQANLSKSNTTNNCRKMFHI